MPHYFDDHVDVESAPERVDVSLRDIAFSFDTDRGVFSRGRLDTGTRLLLQTAPELPATGHLADLGCGAGPIALTMAQRSPAATVWAIDNNERARALTAANAARLGIDNIVVAAPDEVADDVRFACIWSNPPIRIGKQNLHRLLITWLSRLKADGAATLVVQKHLGADSLQRWLVTQGFATERRASRNGFRILTVEPSTPSVTSLT